jgi:hypothetical protein
MAKNKKKCDLCGEDIDFQNEVKRLQDLIARTKVNKQWAEPVERQLKQMVFLETLLKERLEDKGHHDKAKCEHTELINGRKEIKSLKSLLNEWKDAWYQLREIIGDLWWNHPAIDKDESRAYYQAAQAALKDKE